MLYSRVPGVSGVTVSVTGDIVSPAPVGVNDDRAGRVGAARRLARGPSQRRLGLGGRRAGLLRTAGRGEKGGKKGSSLSHFEVNECMNPGGKWKRLWVS